MLEQDEQKLSSPRNFCCELLKVKGPSLNYRRQVGNVKHVQYEGSTYIRRHRTKFSRHGDLTPGFCAPLDCLPLYIGCYS